MEPKLKMLFAMCALALVSFPAAHAQDAAKGGRKPKRTPAAYRSLDLCVGDSEPVELGLLHLIPTSVA